MLAAVLVPAAPAKAQWSGPEDVSGIGSVSRIGAGFGVWAATRVAP